MALPQPKPRSSKTSESQLELVSPIEQIHLDETQISPIIHDLNIETVKADESVLESYSDRRNFWENVSRSESSQDHKKSLDEESIKSQDIPAPAPRVKPRLSISNQSSTEPILEDSSIKVTETSSILQEDSPIKPPMTEYQASFKDPILTYTNTTTQIEEPTLPTDAKEASLEHTDSLDSDNDQNISSGYENTGYISDSGDVEHYISDSEIEDRVPQIRTRQMSVYQPPLPAARRSIYERSASLPTEDLYEVSAQSILLRKQYFEEQIKKDMVEDELMTEIEEEPCTEHKTLSFDVDGDEEELSGVKSVPENVSFETMEDEPLTNLKESFAEALLLDEGDKPITQKVISEVNLMEQKTSFKRISPDRHLEDIIETDFAEKSEEGFGTSFSHFKPLSMEIDVCADISKESARPSDSMEVHVDKSEIEDSEKLADLDQDATDIETKSIDSFVTDLSPKTLNVTEEIPEITISLSGKQRRISETSEESIDKPIDIKSPLHEKPESESPINQPEEHVEDTVWEVSVESQSHRFDERTVDLPVEKQIFIEKDDDLSSSFRDESDLGSEIHLDHSESGGSDRKSENHDIERMILESLHNQRISPEEAKIIASELLFDIEAEIHKMHTLKEYDEPPAPEYAKNQVSEYLKQLAETKGLDSREVQLVQSVLDRKQRELSKLSRGDTQASSMEITDEDLRYSGNDSPIGNRENILEEQIDQLEAEKILEQAFVEVIEDPTTSISTPAISEYTTQKTKSEQSKTEKNTIVEEDETSASESVDVVTMQSTLQTKHSKKDDLTLHLKMSEDTHDRVKSSETFQYTAPSPIKGVKEETLTYAGKIATTHEILNTKEEKSELKDKDVKIDKTATDTSSSKLAESTDLKYTVQVIEDNKVIDDVEIQTTQVVSSTKVSTTSSTIDISHHESTTTSNKILGEIIEADLEKLILSGQLTLDAEKKDITKEDISKSIETHNIARTFSDESTKSSLDETKSPEEPFSTSSSGHKVAEGIKNVVFRKTKMHEDTSSSSSNLKPERKSGIEFEAYSSSGESHYLSFEIDSNKSRPCSSDVEGLLPAGSSEYESAVTSQDISAPSNLTSNEYHTAVSSLSSKESMKSLDSEDSSGHLASIEISEASETLVPSEFEGGEVLDEQFDDEYSFEQNNFQDRQSMDLTTDQQQSIDTSEEEFLNDIALNEVSTKMKRSQEMTFQPEIKSLVPESPLFESNFEIEEKLGTSLDDGSVLSMSLSSTSSVTGLRTVIESHFDSERMALMSSTSELNMEDFEELKGSRDNLTSTPTPITSEMSTSTAQEDIKIDNVTLTTSSVAENGIQSVSTQVVSQKQEPFKSEIKDLPEQTESKKKGHRRNESTSFKPKIIQEMLPQQVDIERKLQFEVSELSCKEGKSHEKKDIDEAEKEDKETEKEKFDEPQFVISDISSDPLDPELRHATGVSTKEGFTTELKEQIEESGEKSKVGQLDHELLTGILESSVIRKKSIDKYTHKDVLESYGKSSSTSSEKSSFEEGEAEAAFSMVAHVSPAHKVKQICTILEDEDAEKHEFETREKARKEYEKRKAQVADPSSIPDIKVTQHMTPMDRKGFHYPDLELEEKDEEAQKSTPQTPASSKSSDSTDQGREYLLDDSDVSLPEESDSQIEAERAQTESRSEIGTVVEKTIIYETDKETASPTESPNSDSFEMLEKPDLMDDFVVIEEVAKEAQEADMEGKSLKIAKMKKIKKHDEEVEEYLVKSAPSPSTKMTDVKYYPEVTSEDLGFDFDDSPPIAKNAGVSTKGSSSPRDYVYEYDRELEANKKWIEQQFQGDQAAMIAAGYGYDMEFERCPLEDIKEEDVGDLDSRIGSLNSQKNSGGSLGSVKDSYSSTPEYDVLAGKKYFTKSGDHDDISMSSLQEFENLERAMSLENRKFHQGSQDSSNGSFKTRYLGRGQGDDISVSSLKEFEGLEKACVQAHKVEVKAREEEAILSQIEELQESMISESESCDAISGADKKPMPESDEEDYEKRMFEIDEIIRQAQTNVERFIDLREGERTESIGRGDSIEEVSKVPDLDLDAPLPKTEKVQWTEDSMLVSTDSLDFKVTARHDSSDSLEQKNTGADIMTASTDSIEFQAQKNRDIMTDSIEVKAHERSLLTSSDSLELATGTNFGLSDSIDEDGSRIGGHDQSSSSTGKDISSSTNKDESLHKEMADFMMKSNDSFASTSAATHATYQYESDSVYSGSFTSGGSTTMVSSTDNMDPMNVRELDLQGAISKMWYDDDEPYVTEVIEPLEGEINRYVFQENVGGDETEEVKTEVNPDGSVRTTRIIKKRTIITDPKDSHFKQFDESSSSEGQTILRQTYIDGQGTKTIYTRKFDLAQAEDPNFVVQSLLSSIAGDTTGESAAHRGSIDREEKIRAESEEAHGSTLGETTESTSRPVLDQSKLSDEMQELLKELEKESKK